MLRRRHKRQVRFMKALRDIATIIALAALVVLAITWMSFLLALFLCICGAFIGWVVLWQVLGVRIYITANGKRIGYLQRFKYHAIRKSDTR